MDIVERWFLVAAGLLVFAGGMVWFEPAPVRIVAFNAAEGWCRDVTVDIADELRRRSVEYEVPAPILDFSEAPPGAIQDWCGERVSAPRLPQAELTKRGSRSDSRMSSGHRSPLIATWWLRL
jgi:hypothetical protein